MKQIMKRVGAFLLTATMVISIAACGTAKNDDNTATNDQGNTTAQTEEKVTLDYWEIYTTDPQKSMTEGIVNQWNQDNPNIQVKISATENEAYKTKIKTAISANEAPDIIYSWTYGFMQPFVEAGKLLELDKYMEEDNYKDKFLPAMLESVTYNGKIYGIPEGASAGALYVNNDLFTQYNVKVPTTWDELLAAVKTFNDNGIIPMGVGEKDLWPGMWYFNMLAVREAGSKLSTNALTNNASFEDPTFVKAAADLLELVDANAFDPGVLGVSNDEAQVQFTQGKCAMFFGGNWYAGTFEADESSVKGKVSAVPFPTIDGQKGDPNEYLGGPGNGLLISANTKYPDAAVKAAKYIVEQQTATDYMTGTGLPTMKVTVDESKISPLTKQIVTNIVEKSTGCVQAWDIFLTSDAANTHKDLVAKLFGKQISAEEFGKQMQEQINNK